jgi:hypothetical protein
MPDPAERDLPPPPYPPPLPIELNQYDAPVQVKARTRPGADLAKRINRGYNNFIERTPELVAFVQKKLDTTRSKLRKLKAYAKENLPRLSGAANVNISKLKHQSEHASERVVSYVLEDAPLYSAFMLIGGTAVAFSLFLALIVSPSVWVIILLAGLLQIGVGKYLQAKNR